MRWGEGGEGKGGRVRSGGASDGGGGGGGGQGPCHQRGIANAAEVVLVDERGVEFALELDARLEGELLEAEEAGGVEGEAGHSDESGVDFLGEVAGIFVGHLVYGVHLAAREGQGGVKGVGDLGDAVDHAGL